MSLAAASTARRVRPALTLAAAATAVGVVSVVDPNEAGHYPTCPFHALTGWFCPGCGSLRAVHALGHGDVLGALDLNALLVLVGLPLLALLWVQDVRGALTGAARPLGPAWRIVLLGGVVAAFWLVRNLPIGAPLAP